ncbi:ANO1 [Acanthosepion pharaonis]|uniref:ANO1 n=1 Tax=Acanthosepion pharaonis TaxID=158019 RepID=A0A812DCW5_ACAPH|nr:ANO1 [Sepia pharaonis]
MRKIQEVEKNVPDWTLNKKQVLLESAVCSFYYLNGKSLLILDSFTCQPTNPKMSGDQEMQDVRKHILEDTQGSDNADIMGDIENALDYQDFDDTEQGRQLYFDDGVRRIDYILAWETTGKKMMEAETARLTFYNNLKKEFLELEEDKSDPDVHFMKVHAPFDVLRRYAELLKLKVPMKETADLLEYAEQYDEQV